MRDPVTIRESHDVGKCMKLSGKRDSETLGNLPLPFTRIHVESAEFNWEGLDGV